MTEQELITQINEKTNELNKIYNEINLLKIELNKIQNNSNATITIEEKIKIFESYFKGRDDV